MRALLAGLGGIGANVYYPELTKLGYQVDTLDIKHDSATFSDLSEVKDGYDIGVICTPNFTHYEIAEYLATKGTRDIFVEKPGVIDSVAWSDLTSKYESRFHVVKNNLYRDTYGGIFDAIDSKTVIGIDINWLNSNRIPNPGSWFTSSNHAFRGVSGDLMPHLYCFALKIFGLEEMTKTEFIYDCYQRWTLKDIKNTDYGVINPDGVFDVDDYATARALINGIPVRMTASWKEGYDKQSITLFFSDGTTYEWVFGLCPAEAYGKMLSDLDDTTYLDTMIHCFLEGFKLED